MIPALQTLADEVAKQLHVVFTTELTAIPALDLKMAMEHMLLNSGKQIRPLLVYATGQLFETAVAKLHAPASAVELMHLYSLIHDDLPSMDNTDYRRGQLSCHKLYGEGIAVLTGDALFALAMQLLAVYPAPLTSDQRVKMIAVLSEAVGPFGMVSGQALDMTALHEKVSISLLEHIYLLKTGRLFAASCEMARIAAGNDDELAKISLQQFSHALALAFQIQDDLLDQIEGCHGEVVATSLNATDQLTSVNRKYTYPAVCSNKQAKEKVKQLYADALEALYYFGSQATLLRQLTEWLCQRVP